MAKHLYLNDKECVELEQLIRAGINSARVIGRARTLLLLDRSQGKKRTIQEVADAAMVSPGTVSNLKRRYIEGGITGALYDKPRPGAKRKVDGEVEARLIALTCSDPPEGYERWTLRLLANELVTLEVVEYISHVTVREVLKKTNLSLGK
jgi:transposase